MSKITEIGKAGIELIKSSESFRGKPYLCPAGIGPLAMVLHFTLTPKKGLQKMTQPFRKQRPIDYLWAMSTQFLRPWQTNCAAMI